MDLQPLQLPLWALVRQDQIDDVSRKFTLAPDASWLGVTVAAIRCLPLFTTAGAIRNFLSQEARIEGGSYGLLCDAKKLLVLLDAFKPNGIVVDPSSESGAEDVLDTGIIHTWLCGEADNPNR